MLPLGAGGRGAVAVAAGARVAGTGVLVGGLGVGDGVEGVAVAAVVGRATVGALVEVGGTAVGGTAVGGRVGGGSGVGGRVGLGVGTGVGGAPQAVARTATATSKSIMVTRVFRIVVSLSFRWELNGEVSTVEFGPARERSGAYYKSKRGNWEISILCLNRSSLRHSSPNNHPLRGIHGVILK